MKKRWSLLLAAVLLACMLPVAALAAIPDPTEAFYVNDFAGVISTEDREYMLDIGAALAEETTAEVVAVTVNFLDGKNIEEYMYELFNKWKIGDASKNNGLLLLVSVGDRDVYIMAGTGLESQFSATVIGRYLDDYAVPYLKDDDFSTAMRNTYDKMVERVAAFYGTTIPANPYSGMTDSGTSYEDDDMYYDNYYQEPASSGFGFGGIMGIIIGVIVLIVIISVVSSLFRSAGNASGCLFGWLLGRNSSRGYRRRSMWMPPPPRGPMGGGPRTRPPGGRSTGGFGGFGGGGMGGGRSSGGGGGRSRPSGRVGGGGGSTRGGGAGRKF